MATWKKVIVSGSAAELSSLSLTSALTVPNGGTGVATLTSASVLIGNGTGTVTFKAVNGNGNIVGTTNASGLEHSGSFSGSFQGNGSLLTGVTATAIFPTVQLTPITSTAQLFANDGANKYVTVGQVTASAYAGVSGDITISTAGVATIAANSVALGTDTTGNYVQDITAGAGIVTLGAASEGTSHTINVNSGSMAPYFATASWAGITGDIAIAATGVATIQAGAVAVSTDISGLGTNVATALGTAVGSAGSFVVNGGVLGTPSSGTLTNATGLPISTGVSGLGTGVATALGTNIGTAGAVLVNGGALGTPSSGTLTNATGLPISTGVSGLGTGVATFLATPSSANLISAITDETGTGQLVFSNNPAFSGSATFAALSTTGNVTVGGNLTVTGIITGSATYINSTNVSITDQFLLLASGSGATVDAGIIVQDAAGDGEAFYWENNTTGTSRWAIASSVNPAATTVTAAEYMVSAKTAAGAPSGNPTYGGATNGYGNIYVNSSNGDIYIFS